MFKSIGESLNENSEALEFLNRMAKLNSPNGDIYDGGKKADEILTEIDSKRLYRPQGYDCTLCGNKGGMSTYNKQTGRTEWVACVCQSIKIGNANVANSGLGELLAYRIKDFVVKEPFQEDMKTKAAHYVMNATHEWFLALGQPGCGKTMLCSAICNQRLKEGKAVRYIIWNEFMSTLKNMKFDNDREEYYQGYLKADVLYLDDMLKGKPTDYELKIAFEIINYRYNNKKVTIISSELLIDDLRDLDEAIASRMYQMAKGYVIAIGKDKDKNYRFKQGALL